jgi:hypothetical protein
MKPHGPSAHALGARHLASASPSAVRRDHSLLVPDTRDVWFCHALTGTPGGHQRGRRKVRDPPGPQCRSDHPAPGSVAGLSLAGAPHGAWFRRRRGRWCLGCNNTDAPISQAPAVPPARGIAPPPPDPLTLLSGRRSSRRLFLALFARPGHDVLRLPRLGPGVRVTAVPAGFSGVWFGAANIDELLQANESREPRESHCG